MKDHSEAFQLRNRLEVALELLVNTTTPESPTVEIGWCVLPGVLEHLKEREAVKPHVLLVMTDARGRERRQLEPLEQGLAFVSFRLPGKNIVHGTIVWSNDGIKRLKDVYLRKTHGEYVTTMLDDLERIIVDRPNNMGHSKIDIIIDRKCFAPEPPEWLQNWVNLMFETNPVDECAFRRRAILAFTVQPPILLAYYPLKFIAMLGIGLWWMIVLGRPGVDFRALWPIAGAQVEELLTHRSRYSDSFWAHPWRWQFSPLFLMGVTAFMGIITLGSINEKTHRPTLFFYHNLLQYMRVMLMVVVAAYVLTAVILTLSALVSSIPMVAKWFDERAREEDRQRALAETQLIETSMSYLVCTGDIPRPVSLNSLPPKQRTFDLRFKELKARVCRPFAG